MRFKKALYLLIDCILAAPPDPGPSFLNKMYLSNVYMSIWVHLDNIPSGVFLVPKATPE